MLNIDRHIAFQAGWVAGPAFGVAMMAAPNYFKLEPPYSGLLFWGGISLFSLTIVVVLVLSLHEDGRRRAVFWPILTMALGALIFCGGTAWYRSPSRNYKNRGAGAKSHRSICTKTFYGMRCSESSRSLAEGSIVCLTIKPNPRTIHMATV
jgi:hypothetical protein